MSQLPGFAGSLVSRLWGSDNFPGGGVGAVPGATCLGFGWVGADRLFSGVPLSFAAAERWAGWLGQTCPSCTGCGVAILARC